MREVALFNTALVAAVEEPLNPLRRIELMTSVTTLIDAYRTGGAGVDTVLTNLRALVHRRERFKMFEDEVIQHAITQFHP